MKAVILAGGLGTRLSEETGLRPKPMVSIGQYPILWHIMKIYYFHGIREFIICCGYKGDVIKQFFDNYYINSSDITFDFSDNSVSVHRKHEEDWKVTLVDTGPNTMTGGRLKRVAPYLSEDQSFCFTYGDGLSDVNIRDLVDFHRGHGKEATLTATRPSGRFGSIDVNESGVVENFSEKKDGEQIFINGGFFVLNNSVLDTIADDSTIWEKGPLEDLAHRAELMAYRHLGFWQPMDTLFEKNLLNEMWNKGNAPWKVW